MKKSEESIKLSLVINVKNMAATLGKTLASAQDIVDEIIVVDMHSTDDSKAVAKRFDAKIFDYKDDLGFADPARNFALSKASGEWILVLDADEELSPGLKKYIQQVTGDDVPQDARADCYFLPRQNIVFGKPMEHTGWWPDFQLRLFKKGHARWTEHVHTHPETTGIVIKAPARPELAILHHNYQTVAQFVERLNRYTSLQAQRDEKLHSEVSDGQFFTPSQAVQIFSAEFFQRFFVSRGIDDNLHGLSLSLLQANYELIVFLKQWESAGFPQTHNDQKETMKALAKFQKDLRYWIADWHVKHTDGFTQIIWEIRRKLQK